MVISRILRCCSGCSYDETPFPTETQKESINKEYRADQKFFGSSLLTYIKGHVLLASPYEMAFYYKAIGRL
jgi:hypothetical protein